MSYPHFTILSVGGYCPCQAHGYVRDGIMKHKSTYAFYFRARHGEWYISVGPVNEPHDDKYDMPKEPSEVVAQGEDDDDGWMDPTDAVALIKEHLGAWFRAKHPLADEPANLRKDAENNPAQSPQP